MSQLLLILSLPFLHWVESKLTIEAESLGVWELLGRVPTHEVFLADLKLDNEFFVRFLLDLLYHAKVV